MTFHRWTPNGRKAEKVSSAEYATRVTQKAKTLVRETGYHLTMLIAEDAPKDDAWSRSCALYMEACELLFAVDPDAEQFCRRTYDPGSEYRFLA